MRGLDVRAWVAGVAVALAAAAAISASPAPAISAPTRSEESSLLLGEFNVARVIDGDTIAVEGLAATVRCICIDTEEVEKGAGAEERTQEIAADYERYAAEMMRRGPFPKFSTPMGWEAKKFAEEWFPPGSRVRIEYDRLSRKTDFYGRALAYIFARRGGEWINFNIGCVREGMSPYCDKYGRSARFEAELIAAERDARIHGRGIWHPHAKAYPDYDRRLAWWSRRSWTISHFEHKYGPRAGAVSVEDEKDWLDLGGLIGREVLLFGTFAAPGGKKPPFLLEMSHKQFDRVGVLFANGAVFEQVNEKLAPYSLDYIYARGLLGAGAEVDGRPFEYILAISAPEQIFVEIPESAPPAAGLPSGQPAAAEPASELPAAAPGDIHWRDAPAHDGKSVSVVGRIVRTTDIGNMTFLNFDLDYRNTLTIVIKKESYKRFPKPPETAYRGRTVRVRGTVGRYRGAPQIVVTDPSQIEIIESKAP